MHATQAKIGDNSLARGSAIIHHGGYKNFRQVIDGFLILGFAYIAGRVSMFKRRLAADKFDGVLVIINRGLHDYAD